MRKTRAHVNAAGKPMKTTKKKVTAIYVRVSTGHQNLESQLDETRQYCKLRQLTKVRIYQEKLSAVKHRPELERMMQDVRVGSIGAIVVYKLDRLGRSLTHMALIIEELQRLNVALVCTSQGIDTIGGSAAGKLQLMVLLAVAEFERELIRERTVAGLKAARKRGSKLGRPPKARNLISRIHKLRREQLSIRAIAKKLRISVGSVGTLLQTVLKEQRSTRRPARAARRALPRGRNGRRKRKSSRTE